MEFAEKYLGVERLRFIGLLFKGGKRCPKESSPPNETKTMNTTLTRWNPARDLEDIQTRLSNVFGLPSFRKDGEKEFMTVAEWAPTVDITEDDKEYLVKAELPEVKKDDVKVTVENGILSIAGERKFEKEDKGKRYHRIERSYGSFARSFGLPDDADPHKVDAKFSEGVLTVHVSKSESAKPRQIEVKVS